MCIYTREVRNKAEGWCARISKNVTRRDHIAHKAVAIATHIQTIDCHR